MINQSKEFGMIVRWVGVPNPEHDTKTGRLFFPRCDDGSCWARPPFVVTLTETVFSDVRVLNTLHLCRHHTEKLTGRPVERRPARD